MQINSGHILKYCLWNSLFSLGNAETGIFQSPPCHPHPLQKTPFKDKSLVWSFPRKQKQKHYICYFVSKKFTHSCKMQALWSTVTLTLADEVFSRRGRVPGIEPQGFKEMPRVFVPYLEFQQQSLRIQAKGCIMSSPWLFRIPNLKVMSEVNPWLSGNGLGQWFDLLCCWALLLCLCLHTHVLFFR